MIERLKLCELIGLAPTTLQDWIVNGIVRPTVPGGKGRGNAAKFDLMTAVGVAVAAALFKSDRSCVPAFVKSVVAAFASLPEKKLLEKFAEGRTHSAGAHQGQPWLQGPDQGPVFDWPNVKAIYEQVKAAMTEGNDAAS